MTRRGVILNRSREDQRPGDEPVLDGGVLGGSAARRADGCLECADRTGRPRRLTPAVLAGASSRPARVERVGDRLGRLEVGQRAQLERVVAEGRQDPRVSASASAKEPSGCDRRRLVGQVPADEDEHPGGGRQERDRGRPPRERQAAPASTGRRRGADPDQREHQRIGECVVVVVGQTRHHGREAGREDRQRDHHPGEPETEPADRHALDGVGCSPAQDHGGHHDGAHDDHRTDLVRHQPGERPADHPQRHDDEPGREGQRVTGAATATQVGQQRLRLRTRPRTAR